MRPEDEMDFLPIIPLNESDQEIMQMASRFQQKYLFFP